MVSQPSTLSAVAVDTLLIAQQILQDIDTPISLSVWIQLRYFLANPTPAAWDQLNAVSVSASDYLDIDIDRFRRDYCASVLLSKFPNLLGLDLKQRALDAFDEAEYRCSLANQAFLNGSIHLEIRDHDLHFDQFRHIVSKVLGRAPSWSRVLQMGGWGPGASFACSNANASPELKSEYDSTITLELARALQSHMTDIPSWFNRGWALVPGNLITTVPKNFKTDRTIAIEPGINSWCQKGIGSAMRRRLRRFGINLNDQSHNATAALEALSADFVTLDLKAASDSISLGLCEACLPSDWLELVLTARSSRGSFDKRSANQKTWFEYQKVSSMGNGFTFELESVLFFCILLLSGVPENLCFVYGDDLVFPKEYVSRVHALLSLFGFTVNDEKSFTNGLFFESCGVYSFNGVDVTPIKMKDYVHGDKDAIILANKVRMFAHTANYFNSCDRRYLPSWRVCVSRLSRRVRTLARGSVGSGLTLFCNRNECKPRYIRTKALIQTYQLVPKLKVREKDFFTLLQYRIYQLNTVREQSLYDLSSTGSGNVVKTTHTGVYRLARLCFEKWYPLGDWLLNESSFG